MGRPQGSKNKNLKLAGKEKEIRELLAQGVSKTKISKIYGVSRISLYHFIKITSTLKRRKYYDLKWRNKKPELILWFYYRIIAEPNPSKVLLPWNFG